MSKLATAIASAAALGAVGAGVVALHSGDTKPKPIESVKAQPHSVVLRGACPERPTPPDRIACWTERGPNRAYRDCTDSDRMGDCTHDADAIEAKKKAQLCPMCIPDCQSSLPAEHEADVAEYERAHERCPLGMRTAGDRCICYTEADSDPEGSEDVADIPAAAKHVLLRCRQRDEVGEGEHVVTRWVPADRPVPHGCQAVSRAVFDPRSMRGVRTDYYRAMVEACDPYPIRPGDHGHCPACVAWQHGCPPCRMLAERYGERWRGHEDECPGEGEI